MRLRYVLIFLFAMAYSYVLFAENESSGNEQSEEVKTKSTSKKSKRGQVKTLKEFIPSEEVSADKPVAFPADI